MSMRIFFVLFILFAAYLSCCLGDAPGPTPDNPFAPDPLVSDLSDVSFNEFVSSTRITFVEFYAPWCSHCRGLAPAYHQLATKLSEEGSDVKLARVNCEENPAVKSSYSIQSYPTLKIFHGQQPYDYDGDRSFAALYSAAKDHEKKDWEPPKDYTKWLTQANFSDSLADAPLALVSFTSTSTECSLCKSSTDDLVKTARKLKSSHTAVEIFLIDCDVSSSSSLCNSVSKSSLPALFLYRHQHHVKYSGPVYNVDNMVKFLQEEAATSLSRLQPSRKAIETFVGSNTKVSVVAFFGSDISSDIRLRDSTVGQSWLLFVAENRADEGYQFGHVYGEDGLDLVQGGLTTKDLPAVCITQPKKYHKSKEGDYKTYCRSVKVPANELSGELAAHDVLTAFLVAHRLPVVASYTWSIDSWFPRPLFLLFMDSSYVDPSTAKEAQYWRSKLYALAQRFSSATPSLRFAIASLDEESILKRLNLQCNEAVCAGILTKDGGPNDDPHGLRSTLNLKNPDLSFFRLDRFPLNEEEYEATSQGIEDFVDDFLKGKAQPLIKSAATPSADLKKHSVTFPVTAATIFDVLIRSPATKDKDFLVVFYTTEKGCAPCETAKERADALALRLKADKQTDVLVAVYDMAVNDVPVVYEHRKSIPYAFFIPADDRLKPVEMPLSGPRMSADAVTDLTLEFLGTHSKKLRRPHKPKDEL